MDEKKRAERDAELDRFWDIDSLIPARRAHHYAADTSAADVILEPATKEDTSSKTQEKILPKRHFIPPHHAPDPSAAPKPLLEYAPSDSLIRRVRLFRAKGSYHYYEDFLRDAKRLYPVKGLECPHVPFFSYVPQYSQLSRAQLEWYLWWRECFRRGDALPTDYSYVLLYSFELINLGAVLGDPLSGQSELLRLWLSYRDIFHQLDSYLPEWICDYSLIHRLPSPKGLEGSLLHAAMSRTTLREFYMTSSGDEGLVRGLPVFCSDYDFHKSKFFTKENRALYESLIYGVLLEVGRKTGKDGHLFSCDESYPSRLLRPSYKGALCASSVKREIEVEYTSFTCSYDLRALVTDVIKYTENQIRAALGIHSRLSVYTLRASMREMIDAYLAPRLPRRTAPSAPKAEIPAYERHYDLPRTTLSQTHAAMIEQSSWETTKRLVEAFGCDGADEREEHVPEPIGAPKPTEPACRPDDCEKQIPPLSPDPWALYRPFLRAILACDRVLADREAERLGKKSVVLADEINALAFDTMGDILLEEIENGYGVIEDYLTDAEQLLQDGKDDL